jgi:hypothetical protein
VYLLTCPIALIDISSSIIKIKFFIGSYLKGVDALLVIIDDKKLSNQVMVFEFS